jgi:hypothetical protein
MSPLASARAGDWVGKKLIYLGPVLYPADLRASQAAIEALPFDGIAISIPTRDGPLGALVFGDRRYHGTDPEIAAALRELLAISWRRPLDNFLVARVQPAPWFDDARWATVEANWRLLAALARVAGARGIVLDTEGDGEPFARPLGAEGRPADESRRKAEERGQALMAAARAEFPGIEILPLWSYTAALPNLAGRWNPQGLVDRDEWSRSFELLPAFLDGILKEMGAADSGASSLTDGYEFSSVFRSAADFDFARRDIRAAGRLVSRLPDEYARRVRAGFGVNLDFHRPDELESALSAALHFSDRYVWLRSDTRNLLAAEASAEDPVLRAIWRAGGREYPVTGVIQGIGPGPDGTPQLEGWACARGYPQPIEIQVFANAPGASGVLIGGAPAKLEASADVAEHCGSEVRGHRFAFPLPPAVLEEYAGAPIHVLGVSPLRPAEAVLEGSGIFRVPKPLQ